MSAAQPHAIDRLIELAEETSRIMWRSHDAHLALSRHMPDWEKKAAAIFRRCLDCDERLGKLKALREKTIGRKAQGKSCNGNQSVPDAEKH